MKVNPSSYSLIYLENPFIIPGGRFRECYYWDSYWTILGLLASEMNETVKGDMIQSISFEICYDSLNTILIYIALMSLVNLNFLSGMLYNFSTLVSLYGMIPNGNRVYFTRRSQPPLFISMVNAYYEVYGNVIWS